MESEVVVRGVGEVSAMPDLASVRVEVEGDGQTRDEAYEAASKIAAEVDRVLVDFDSAVERVTTAALAVEPKTRWRKGETQRTGWRALRVSILEIGDTAQVADLLSALAGAGSSISGLSWTVAPTNPSFAMARRRAGEDAGARARQYASALGVELGGVAWAREPGIREPRYPDPSAGVLAARAMGASSDETISVSPEEVTIREVLEVGFRIVAHDRPPAGQRTRKGSRRGDDGGLGRAL